MRIIGRMLCEYLPIQRANAPTYQKKLPSNIEKILPSKTKKKVPSEFKKILPSEPEKKVLDFYTLTCALIDKFGGRWQLMRVQGIEGFIIKYKHVVGNRLKTHNFMIIHIINPVEYE